VATEKNILYAVNRLATVTATDKFLPSAPPSRNFTVQATPFGVYYRTNFGFMAGAVISMIVCVLLVLPSYWKFWELGRPMSLTPAEIANAFHTPALNSSKASNAMVEDLLKAVGNRRFMFGEGPQGRLAVEEIGKVRRVGAVV
jgi:hypothetical protein